ncbi:jg6345 [Pararge aegeria aegeria]|uniref:Jg6345 protein n=1 Tax=Pararge aegeria aegeria TaxID=348720 RepID=A0A8S4RRF9_9NEOP|nr:jg6345 [Pararge aegeria aegeria]
MDTRFLSMMIVFDSDRYSTGQDATAPNSARLLIPANLKQESNLDNIVDQLCTRLQDIKDQEGASLVGMPTCSLEQTEAVRRYYAAFPALKKGEESPLQYYLPPPAWCRKATPEAKVKMQSELLMSKDWNSKNKKYSSGKERRNSYHSQKKNNRKRYNSYSRSFEKEHLPEWMTHEEVWDMESQDPVKEFIRAIALDEGYGTCENTMTDELKEITQAKLRLNENMVPNWDDSLDLDAEWVITDDLKPRVRTPMEEELYAKFEAKFDRSIEALWSKDQNTPDDEYQDLPIDFQDLLSSPSDHLFADPSAEKCSLVSLNESIWSTAEILQIMVTVHVGVTVIG